MKVVVNADVGGFSLSIQAYRRLVELGFPREPHIEEDVDRCMNMCYPDIERNNPLLIRVVEELGKAANGYSATLRIIEIPDDVDWEVYDNENGSEYVAEKHRKWIPEYIHEGDD